MTPLRFVACLLLLTCGLTTAHAQKPMDVYVSEGGGEHVAHFEFNPADGTLSPKNRIRVGRAPGAQTVDHERRLLHVSVVGENRIATLRIGDDGALEMLQVAEAPHRPTYLALDHSRRVLLSAYYGGNLLALHRLNDEGLPSQQPTQVVETDEKAHAVEVDPANRFVYVPCCVADTLVFFRLDAENATLTAPDKHRVSTAEGDNPRHLWFHPEQPLLFVVNERADSVTVYRHDRDTGDLESLQSESTLPASFDGSKNTCADIEFAKSRNLLVASNRGHNSLAVFSVDPDGGRITPRGQVPTEETPRSFNIDPTERWLIAAGQASHKLAVYAITDDAPYLDRKHTLDVGRGPSWVQFVPRR